jgi:PAS domain S-box-containing protein
MSTTLTTDTQPISLLCVDDDEWVLDALKKFFEREPDFSLFTCSSGSDALTIISQYQFDAIIADYSMPDIDGITLLKEIRSQNDFALFIMFTGRHLAQVAIETLNNGGNYYVQKGVEILHELPKVRDFIRNSVQIRRRDRHGTIQIADQDTRYRSLIEQQHDLLCCFLPDGTCTLANEAFSRFTGYTATCNLLTLIPEDEREEIKSLLNTLTPENTGTYIEHDILDRQGMQHLYQWGYRGFFDESGVIIEYLAQGRDISNVVRLANILPKGSVSMDCGSVQDPAKSAKGIVMRTELCNLGDSIEMVQYPIFAIDLDRKVIAWNHAIAEFTGVDARTMIGQGNHAYAFPIYSETRPMLIDYILDPAHTDTSRLPPISRDGESFIGDLEEVTIRGKPVKIGSKGTAIHDGAGKTIAAIQSLLVREQFPETGNEEREDTEHYIGGISSIILKIAGEGFSGSIAGAIGSATGGYGVYATDRRLFVVHNPNLDASRSEEMQFSEFLMNELFGTSVDTRPRSINELEKNKVFEVWRKDIATIDMKTPRFLSGFLIIRTKAGGSFRIYVDHKKAFVHLEQLLKLFYPDILGSETSEIDTADAEWLDEVRTFELIGKLQLDDPLQGISRNLKTGLPTLPPLPDAPSIFPSVTTSAGKWNNISNSIKKVPYPIFAIDLDGKVIAWNDAIGILTGIAAADMIGKRDYEYAIPFYGMRKPMLIDFIIMPPDTPIPGELPAITREGDTYIGSLESVTIRDKPMLLWGKGTGIYDPKGAVIGSIQSILVSEQPSMKAILGIYEEETYIGGISSITVKVPGGGVTGAISGALGSSTGGYGVYATDQRLFIIRNPTLNAEHPNGVQFGPFIMDELFGTTVDTRPRSIIELDKEKIVEIWRKDIVTIEMKKPLLFAGYISFNTRSGESFRVYIDHKMAFIHLDQLLRLFFPEIVRIE